MTEWETNFYILWNSAQELREWGGGEIRLKKKLEKRIIHVNGQLFLVLNTFNINRWFVIVVVHYKLLSGANSGEKQRILYKYV